MAWRPTAFVGSSGERISTAKELKVALESWCDVVLWPDTFPPTSGTLDSLVRASAKYDIAILIVDPDDSSMIRGKPNDVPRDNVVFELGLFLGALGAQRTFFVHSREKEPHLPTDLAGVTALRYSSQDAASLPRVADAIQSVLASEGACRPFLRRRFTGTIREMRAELIGEAAPMDEEQYLKELTRLLGTVKAGREFRAVCGAKAWGSPEVTTYMDANYQAARDGVIITRIFMQHKASFGHEEVRQGNLHSAHDNMKAFFISEQSTGLILARYGWPPGFGVAACDTFAVFHYGLGTGHKKVGEIYTERKIVSELMELTRELELKARPWAELPPATSSDNGAHA